jgi:hypothetical protein
MDEKDSENGKAALITIVERRSQRQAELSSAEIMRILRKRAVKGAWKNNTGGSKLTD